MAVAAQPGGTVIGAVMKAMSGQADALCAGGHAAGGNPLDPANHGCPVRVGTREGSVWKEPDREDAPCASGHAASLPGAVAGGRAGLRSWRA